MNYKISNQTKVAVDVEDLTTEAVMNALLAEKGELFKTSRNRKAILIGQAALIRLRREYSLNLEEGTDGCSVLRG